MIRKRNPHFVGFLLLLCLPILVAAAPKERAPAVAGSFYPDDPAQLAAAVRGFMAKAKPPEGGAKPLALIAPHAGIIFSGQIAADAYSQAASYNYDLIVILGTNHTVAPFKAGAVSPSDGFRTPLGLAGIDRETARVLTDGSKRFSFQEEPHRREHSIEVQLPFIQILFPRTPILPIIVGDSDPDLVSDLGKQLAKVLTGKSALIVASSDLSHYPAYDDAEQVDHATLELIATMKVDRIHDGLHMLDRPIPALVTRACGEAPILTAIAAVREMGARSSRIVSYANSGDTAVGDHERVVGYGAVVFTAQEGPIPAPPWSERTSRKAETAIRSSAVPGELSKEAQVELLSIAREAITRYLAEGTVSMIRKESEELTRKSGAFVTLKKSGHLRGCIGRMVADTPLAQTVGQVALQAAFEDPRFSPVTAREMPSIDIEISVLTIPKAVSGASEIVVGRDGVILWKDGRSATFLPQVAGEQGWGRDEMLGQLCLKAGLPSECWKSGAQFRTYQAFVFAEKELRAEKAK